MTTALEQLTQSALAATVQSAPEVPKYTLEKALPLLKDKYDLYRLSEAIDLLYNANSAWERIKDCEVSLEILNQFYDGCASSDEDFFSLDIASFIYACESITADPDEVKIPESLIDDYYLEEYFKNNADEFWEMIDWGSCIDKDDVREKYIESGEIDLSEYIENFKL